MDLKLSDLLKQFFGEIDCSQSTIETYKRVLWIFIKWMAVNKLTYNTVKLTNLIEFKRHIQKKNESRTINLYMAVVSRFYAWLEENGYYSNIAKRIKKEPVSKYFQRLPLSVDEAQKLLANVDTSTLIGKRDRCILNVLLNVGLRRSELTHINCEDLYVMSNGKYCLRLQRKGHASKDATKLIAEDIYKEMKTIQQLFAGKPDSPLFVTCVPNMEPRRLSPYQVSHIVKQNLKAIGLTDKRYSCHSMRHTTALLLYEQGVDVYSLAEYLGHSSIATTQLYLSMAREKARWDATTANELNNLLKKR